MSEDVALLVVKKMAQEVYELTKSIHELTLEITELRQKIDRMHKEKKFETPLGGFMGEDC